MASSLPSPQPTNTKPVSPNPSPRSQFMQSAQFIREHKQLIESEPFKRAIQYSLAEMTRAICALSNGQELDKPGAIQAQATSFEMINGAHNLVEVLFRLADPYATVTPKPQSPENLEHQN